MYQLKLTPSDTLSYYSSDESTALGYNFDIGREKADSSFTKF